MGLAINIGRLAELGDAALRQGRRPPAEKQRLVFTVRFGNRGIPIEALDVEHHIIARIRSPGNVLEGRRLLQDAPDLLFYSVIVHGRAFDLQRNPFVIAQLEGRDYLHRGLVGQFGRIVFHDDIRHIRLSDRTHSFFFEDFPVGSGNDAVQHLRPDFLAVVLL